MRKAFLTISVILLFCSYAKAQTTPCNQLIDYVYKNGRAKDKFDSFLFRYSSWLKEVESYTIDNKIVVIATLSNNGLNKQYIFCDVPPKVWDSFYNNRMFLLDKTVGEQFHEYIYSYKCNCQ